MRHIKQSILIIFSFFITLTLPAVDFTFTASPAASFSLNKDFPVGFSGFTTADVNLFNMITVGVEGNYSLYMPNGFVKPIQLYGGGMDSGVYYSFFSRLHTGIGASFGLYSGYVNVREQGDVYNTYNPTGFFYRGYGEIGFRFTPDIILIGTGGYYSYVKPDFSNFYNGFYAGAGIRLNKSVGGKKVSKLVDVSFEQYDSIYPFLSRVYRDNECGVLTITNNESAEIRNVRVSFDAEKYTNSVIECGRLSYLNRYKKAEIPLLIDFSDSILNFTEDGMISGTVTVEYELLGQKRTAIQSLTIQVKNRNAFNWSDTAALSAFVSPETPEIQNFAKSIAGIARNQLATGMNRNLQFSAAMFEALRSTGITDSEDTLTPYVTYHLGDETDSVLYPLQTMECLSGDYDDIGILLMACLESQGINCAYMTTTDDFIVFVDLNIAASAAKNHFADVSSVFIDEDNDTVYMPLAMSAFEKGFTSSRKKGSEILKTISNDEEVTFDFILLKDAWTLYRPVVFNVASKSLPKPSNNSVSSQMTTAVKNYISSDLNPIVKTLTNEGADHNKIGVALVRAMRYDEALKEFNKSTSISAMNNIANIYIIQQNYDAALKQYERVLAKDSENAVAKAGIESLKIKLGM